MMRIIQPVKTTLKIGAPSKSKLLFVAVPRFSQFRLPALLVLLACGMTGLNAATDLRVEWLTNRQVVVRWSASETEWALEQVGSLGIPTTWLAVNVLPVTNGAQRSVALDRSAASRFFRLRGAGGGGLLSSEELIAQAVQSGAITAETALIYRVFVLFNDPRLPGAYKGNDAGAAESGALEEAVEQWASLSEATRTALTPFFVPPAYRGSWLNPVAPGTLQASAADRPVLDPNWAAVPVSGGHVKVWYDARNPSEHATALLCANALNNKIWPAITGLGILAPLSDTNTARYDGGDGRLDVYLSDMVSSGVTATHFGISSAVSMARKQHPVFLLINKSKSEKEMIGTLAHEFMHACQWAYPVAAFSLDSYKWLKESTAQWAIDFVYPDNQLEQTFAKYFFAKPKVSLDVFKADENHGYGSYLFFQYLSRAVRPALIKDCWAATITSSDQLAAVNSSIPGGFKDQWPKFAKTLWNQDPIVSKPNSFKTWDSMAEIPGTRTGSADLPAGQAEDTITLGDEQPNLTSTYYQWTFSTSETRSLMFHNTFYTNRKNNEDVNVQAMWKNAAGTWAEEDWTDLEWIGFCRDQKDQRLSELVVIISSAKWQTPGDPIRAAKSPEFKRNNIGCWGYQGTASRVTPDPDSGVGQTTATGTVRFGFRPSGQTSSPQDGRLRAFLTGPIFHDGGLTFNESYTQGGCSYTANGSFLMSSVVFGGDTASSILLNNFPEALPDDLRLEQAGLLGPDQRAYTANGVTGRLITGQVSGVDCEPSYITIAGLWWLTNDTAFEDGGAIPKVRADGHLHGTFREVGGDNSVFTWDLAPIPEP